MHVQDTGPFPLKSFFFLQIPCSRSRCVPVLFNGVNSLLRTEHRLSKYSRLGVSATSHVLRPEDKHYLSVGSSETPALRCAMAQHLELLPQIS